MTRLDRVRSPLPWLGLAFLLSGCNGFGFKAALTGDVPEPPAYDVPVVGDKTLLGAAEPIAIGGVGLVEGLEGTGGDCKHDDYRAMLADTLRKEGRRDVQKLLNSPYSALVIVDARIHPGASKGDVIDVEVKLPPGSKASSLRGGVLRRCVLFNYDSAQRLKPGYAGGASLLKGNAVALAQGPVLMLPGGRGEAGSSHSGRVWGGGRVLKEYPLTLVMNGKSQQTVMTAVVADRINSLFMPGARPGKDSELAAPAGASVVSLRVPPSYRQNLPRYLRVVRFIPLVESATGKSKDGKTYRQQLRDDLLDPRKAVVAALRLEALGAGSVPMLKEGLSSKSQLVRFASAEALAYLQSASCGEALGEAARVPLFRAYALTALASLPESVCQSQLRSLIESDLDDETRMGAFRALHALNPRHPAVLGEKLADSFWLHRAAPGMPALVHLSTSRRAELVLLGDAHPLRAPFSVLAGEFTITAGEADTRCTVARISGGEEARRQCGLDLEEVVRLMADLGCTYSDVITLVQQAGAVDAIGSRVKFDALPRVAAVEEVAASGFGEQDLGQAPTLFSGARP
ncbi:MAG: flagellar basal body P-ring protein FlgI [Gemmataceae bacterium]|nr:flagellar basal body P-ring protein FlgI [Gemmataceae bacterium]